jgi:hypothetical protein
MLDFLNGSRHIARKEGIGGQIHLSADEILQSARIFEKKTKISQTLQNSS